VIAPDYRLAPAHPFPAAFEDAVAVWDRLRNGLGYRAHNLVVAGDSAGGGLGLALLADLHMRGEHPAGAVLMSPWTDLTLSGASFRENADRDVIFPPSKAPALVASIAGDMDPSDSRLSPLFAEWENPPKVWLSVSETELLRDDALRLADRLRAAGGEVTLDVAPNAPHVLPLFYGVLPEADAMLTRAAEFAAGVLTPQSPEGDS
jgi:acetyl esterase/lipase